MTTKVSKQSEKLLFINWKLREQLHELKEQIEVLETQSKEFFVVSVVMKNPKTKADMMRITNVYADLMKAKIILDFFKESFGIYHGEITLTIWRNGKICVDEFRMKEESEGGRAQ